MATLTENVILRDPSTGAPTSLLVGSELPEWAEGLVGGHVLTEPAPKPAKRRTKQE